MLRVAALGALLSATTGFVRAPDASAQAPNAHAGHPVDEMLVHDHTPRHGGVVGMSGTRHVEVVLKDGRLYVHLSDLHRVPLSLDGVTGTATVRDAAAPGTAHTVDLRRRGDALEGPLPKLAGPNVDVRLELTLPAGPLLIEFTLPVAGVPHH